MKLYKFCASWCGKCRRIDDHGAEIIDIDEKKSEALVDKYGIEELPTFVIDKGDSFVKLESPETNGEVSSFIEGNK